MYHKIFRNLNCLLIVIILILSLCSCSNKDVYDLSESISGAEKVKYRDLGYNIALSGVISGNDEISIYSDVNTIISEVSVKKGDTVKKGDVICKFDTTDIQAQIDDLKSGVSNEQALNSINEQKAKADLENAKAVRNLNIKQAQATVDNANSSYTEAYNNYTKYLGLYNDKINEANGYLQESSETAQLTDNYETAMENALEYQDLYTEYYNSLDDLKKAISEAEYNYEQIVLEQNTLVAEAQYAVDQYNYSNESENKSKLTDLENELAKYTVYATCDGVISELNIKQGSLFNGEDLPITTIAKKSGFEVVTYVQEKDILSISNGMEATVSVSGASNINSKGTIEEISLVKDTENNGFKVVIDVEENKSLRLGMSVQINIFVKEVEHTLSAGYKAISKDFDDSYYVYRLKEVENNEGVYELEKVTVEIIQSQYEHIQITSGDISEGDIIISDPLSYNEGELVSLGDSEVQ